MLAPHAARCSGRVRTDSYSSIKGTDKSKSNRRARAASRTWRDAPVSLRKAATSTSVSRTYAFIPNRILQAILRVKPRTRFKVEHKRYLAVAGGLSAEIPT